MTEPRHLVRLKPVPHRSMLVIIYTFPALWRKALGEYPFVSLALTTGTEVFGVFSAISGLLLASFCLAVVLAVILLEARYMSEVPPGSPLMRRTLVLISGRE